MGNEMRSRLLEHVAMVFANAEDCRPPANYQSGWQMPDCGPFEEWEGLELYLAEHPSVFDVNWPIQGAFLPPEWAEPRVAASLCYILLGHDQIEDPPEDVVRYIEPTYTFRDLDDADLHFLSLNDDQWGALLAVCLWSISEEGPIQAPDGNHLHRDMRQVLCRMATCRHLPQIDDEAIASFVWDQLTKLEQPDYAEAMKPPPY